MGLLFDSADPTIDSVLHPTDLSEASERAFHHALALALRFGARFTLLHAVGRRSTDSWPDFPSVRTKVAEWRSAGALGDLGEKARHASVSKIEVDIRDPVAASLKYLERNAVDLIVLATQGRGSLSRLLRPSRAEQLARSAEIPTLFVPHECRYFVDGPSGMLSLSRILVPVDPGSDPKPAMVGAVQAAALVGDPSLEITLLHVGDGDEGGVGEVPDLPYCRWRAVHASGDVVEQILSTATETEADAIYMSTTWSRRGLTRSDGSVTEAVVAGAPCPVMALPVSGS